jgi:hypothetical protein
MSSWWTGFLPDVRSRDRGPELASAKSSCQLLKVRSVPADPDERLSALRKAIGRMPVVRGSSKRHSLGAGHLHPAAARRRKVWNDSGFR